MILIQNLSRLLQINLSSLFLLPGKTRNEIEIVEEHSRFDALLSFLLQAVQNLFSFFSCRLIHAGFSNLFCKFLHIRDILRMHFVQFLLQMLHLLLDGRFAVHLLIFFLLRAYSLICDSADLQKFI